MDNILLSIAQNVDLVGLIMSILTGVIGGLAFSSFLMSRRMYKTRKRAEFLYIESLLQNQEFVEYVRNSDKQEFLIEIHPQRNMVVLNGEDIFIHAFENLDKNMQKQIEPALFQHNLENRKAYLRKVVNEARKTLNVTESHC